MRRAATVLAAVLALGLVALSCSRGPGDFCTLAAEFEDRDFGADDLESREEMEAAFTEALGLLDDLVEAAPDEVVVDMTRLRNEVEDFVRREGTLGPEFTDASNGVARYIETGCGGSGEPSPETGP